MTRIALSLVLAPALLLVACAETTTTSTTVGPPAVEQLIGKQLVAENGTIFQLNRDGTMSGTLNGEDVVGVYTIDGAETCSTYTAPAVLVDGEYCSVPQIDGDTVVFNRLDGSTSQPYTIQD